MEMKPGWTINPSPSYWYEENKRILSSFYIFQTVKFSFGLEILYEPHG
jgi:hypothetical protein